jgi:hypothetical protein
VNRAEIVEALVCERYGKNSWWNHQPPALRPLTDSEVAQNRQILDVEADHAYGAEPTELVPIRADAPADAPIPPRRSA